MNDTVSIICIDDEPSILEISKIFLEREGYVVSIIESPKKALELIRRNQYNVVISDYEMPEMSGIDLFKKIKEDGDPPPFILFSGKNRKSIIFEVINNEIDLYISKGINIKVLYSEMSSLIDSLIRERRRQENVLSQRNTALRRMHQSIDLKSKDYSNREIFNINNSPSILIDENKRIIGSNHSFEILSGYSKQELLNLSWTDFVFPENLPCMSHHHDEEMNGKKPREIYQFKFIDKYKYLYLISAVICVIDVKKSIISFFEIIKEWRKNLPLFFILFY